jgi:hypothetical protein
MKAKSQDPIFDESLVPVYSLPDPLRFLNGSLAESAADWREKRRPEVVRLFEQHVYGVSPGKPNFVEYRQRLLQRVVFGGKGVRKEVVITLKNNNTLLEIDLLLYLPAERQGPAPVFLGLNFNGNHSVDPDQGLTITRSWMEARPGVVHHLATEETRGAEAHRWPVERILERGYGLATVYYGDIDPDFHDGFRNGVHGLYPGDRGTDAWGAVAAWAWGLSRVMDYFETDAEVDASRVAVMGHSRLGKTALWAGAVDERFALVISNNSGCGGAAISRRRFGETVAAINDRFPHWFCQRFEEYNDREGELPVDQHMLIALIAPRPVYVASAAEDLWADPRGEFLGAKHASPVYRLYGEEGLPSDDLPGLEQPLIGKIGYHIRSGGHGVERYDWEQFINFADQYL